MASPGQRIQQSYVNGAGASGGLLAVALIGFIGLVGLVSFSAWPQANAGLGSPLDASLPLARAPQAGSEHSTPGAVPSHPAASLGRSVTKPHAPQAAAGGQARGAGSRHSTPARHPHLQTTQVPPTQSAPAATSAPGNSGSAPGHTKGLASRDSAVNTGPGHGPQRGPGAKGSAEDGAHGPPTSPGHGNGRGNGNRGSRGNSHGNGHGAGPKSG